MTLSEFISKWICSDSFGMMGKQGAISFVGLTALARFPPATSGNGKDIVYAFNLVEVDENDLQSHLSDLDRVLTEEYGDGE